MSVTVRVINLVPKATAQVNTRVATAVRTAAFMIEREAKVRAPVDTGYLRNSINANGDGMDWKIDSPAEYSIYQEFGTYRMAAHPYLIPGLEAVKPWLESALRKLA